LVRKLDRNILMNPASKAWETTGAYLSGNVVAKLEEAEQIAAENPEVIQLARSLAAIRRVQPEKIPFEVLDFNLGERWIPISYYEQFASDLFSLETNIE
jgi:N12 class adenine-specific DNA methylase